MSHPCFATQNIEDETKKEAAKHEHHHTIAKDPQSKSGNHHSTLSCYDLIVQQEAKGASNHSLNQRSLQRTRKFRSKREDNGIWGYQHFLYTVKEEEEGESEEQHSHSHASLQRSNNSKSNHVSIMDCYDLIIKSKENRGGALGGMQHSSSKYTHSHSKEQKEGDRLERSRSQTSLSYGIYSRGAGIVVTPSKTELSSMKKRTKSRLAYNGSTSCYSLFFLCLLRPLKRLRDQYIKCCFSLAGAGDLSCLVGEGHVVGPLFYEWFPQESKFGTPSSDNTLLW